MGGRQKQTVGLWGLRTGRMACCIFNFQSHDYRADSGIPLDPICRPTQFQLPIFHSFLGGRSLRRLEGARIELSSVQLVHKFAATLSNTMIHKQFKNDKKDFGKFGPLAAGRGVSKLAFIRHSYILCSGSRDSMESTSIHPFPQGIIRLAQAWGQTGGGDPCDSPRNIGHDS